jgi:hypothetical protein
MKGTCAYLVEVAGAATAQSQSVLNVDGNLETTHLLEQVRSRLFLHTVFSTCSSLKASGALFASSEWKIHISKVTT